MKVDAIFLIVASDDGLALGLSASLHPDNNVEFPTSLPPAQDGLPLNDTSFR
jgi:hypothetical protein